ncbi:MAG: thioredoxin family protein [Pseudomonadota bacterium]
MGSTDQPHPNGDEIVVFEIKNCIYCQLFRRDVLPGYRLSKRGRVVPMRFLDASRPNARVLGLKQPLKQVPTVVVFRRGQEVGRITGYTGPSAFYQLLNRIFEGAL